MVLTRAEYAAFIWIVALLAGRAGGQDVEKIGPGPLTASGVLDLFSRERYPKANWRNLNLTLSLLAPGKDGPLATARFEMLREGVQECEARIAVQTALDEGKLPAPTADECRKVLADRDEFLKRLAITTDGRRPWFNEMNPSEDAYLAYVRDWSGQSEKLYRAAAETSSRWNRDAN